MPLKTSAKASKAGWPAPSGPARKLVRARGATASALSTKTAEVNGAKAPTQTPSGPSEFRIGFYVHDVSRMRRTLFDHEMKPLGITRSQWWVLAQLSGSQCHAGSQGMLQTDLATILDVGKVTIGGLIDRLETNGFVERRPDRIDRRAKRIVMTNKGRKVLNQMVIVGRRLNLSILQGISEREIKTAEKALARMKANIRDILAPQKLVGGSDDE
jgi:MarR family transcriptional regulator, transcriptional regulator for hemolysin